MRGRLRHAYKVVLRALIYAVAVPPILFFRLMPPEFSSAAGAALGKLAFLIFRRDARLAAARLGRVFPEMSGAERERIAAANFEHFGRSLGEFLSRSFRRNAGGRVSIEGREILDRARTQGRGAVILTAHFGNWEVGGLAVAAIWPGFSVVARDLYDSRFSRMAVRLRKGFGVTTYDTSNARGMLRHLKSGGFLAALVDQDSDRVRNTFVSFFGEKVVAPVGPVLLAARANSMLISALAVPENGGHRVKISLIGENLNGTAPEACIERFNRLLEAEIRANPDRWVWIHDRWRSVDKARAKGA